MKLGTKHPFHVLNKKEINQSLCRTIRLTDLTRTNAAMVNVFKLWNFERKSQS